MIFENAIHQLLTGLTRRVFLPAYERRYQQFQRLAQEARRVQQELLLEWLSRCRDTRFGRDHGFAEMKSVDDYRRRVPIGRYDYFAPYIDAVARGEFSALFPSDEPVERFTITTGTTGTPKLNPVTRTWLRGYRKSWDLWGGKMLYDHLPKVGNKIVQIIGSWNMGQTTGGIPISMVSALLSRHQQRIVQSFYAIPNEVPTIQDPVSRYYTILRLGIAEQIGLIVLMNPGTLLRLAQLGDEHRESLVRDIRDGTLSTAIDVPREIRERLAPCIQRGNPARAHELERIIETTGRLYPKDYWPQPIIACWLGGTAGYQSKYLPEYFGDSPLRDQGLVSSEGRHTIPFEDGKPQGPLAITNGFYEFVPVDEIHSAQPVALEGHELEVDRDYYIVMTTYSGYFRFNIGDIVRCRGFNGQAPLLEFLQRGDRCGDLEGEKVTEHQFLEAANDAAQKLGIRMGTVTAVPMRPGRELPCYVILVEQSNVPDMELARRFLEETDRAMRASNFLYSARRRENVLGPLRLWRLADGTWARFIQAEIERRGTGEAHYKHPALVQDTRWLEQFEPVDRIQFPGE